VSAPSPLAPFDSWPTQLHDPRFGFVWYAHPAVFVDQVHIGHGTAEMARAILELIDLVTAERASEIRDAGGLLLVHDWRAVHSYDKDARTVFTQRVRARQPGDIRGTVVAVQRAHPVLRMAVHAVNLVAAVTSKSPIDIVESFDGVFQARGVAAPSPSEAFPGRRKRTTTRPPPRQ
jgi:hypothetical protein